MTSDAIGELHARAMALADNGHSVRRVDGEDAAKELFRQALELERKAAQAVASLVDVEPTRSVLFRSAATLALYCDEFTLAEQLACQGLIGHPPDFAAEELRDVLEQANFRRHLEVKGVELTPDAMQMSLSGDAVGHGIARVDDVLERIQKAATLVTRTAERQLRLPYRRQGPPRLHVSDQVSTYMTVARPGSYSVSLVVGGQQRRLPGLSLAEEAISEVIDCLEAFSTGSAEVLRSRIADEDYFQNFVGLAHSIEPDGVRIKTVGFTAMVGARTRSVALRAKDPEGNSTGMYLHGLPVPRSEEEAELVTVIGDLRFADSLEHAAPQIRIVDETGKKHRLVVPQGLMNDIVRPLWGRKVRVAARRTGKTRLTLERIQATD